MNRVWDEWLTLVFSFIFDILVSSIFIPTAECPADPKRRSPVQTRPLDSFFKIIPQSTPYSSSFLPRNNPNE